MANNHSQIPTMALHLHFLYTSIVNGSTPVLIRVSPWLQLIERSITRSWWRDARSTSPLGANPGEPLDWRKATRTYRAIPGGWPGGANRTHPKHHEQCIQSPPVDTTNKGGPMRSLHAMCKHKHNACRWQFRIHTLHDNACVFRNLRPGNKTALSCRESV